MKTLKEVINIAVEGRLEKKAFDDIGIYPASVEEVKRTEWQDGWNAALSQFHKNNVAFHKYLSDLREPQKNALKELLLDDVVELSNGDGKITIWLNVNDTFYTAADGESVPESDLELLASLNGNYGFDGVVAWVAKKRGMEPLEFKYKKTSNYLEAEKELNEK
jgi:hypothetical protein